MIKVRTYVVVVFGNDPLEAGVTQLHDRRSLKCNWVTPASSGFIVKYHDAIYMLSL